MIVNDEQDPTPGCPHSYGPETPQDLSGQVKIPQSCGEGGVDTPISKKSIKVLLVFAVVAGRRPQVSMSPISQHSQRSFS
jgi:hypothetical protein